MEHADRIVREADFRISYSQTRVERPTTLEHFHDAFELNFYVKADMKIFLKDRKYDVVDGDMLFIDEYELHHIQYHETARYERYVINFKRDCVEGLLRAASVDGLLERLRDRPYLKTKLDPRRSAELEARFDAVWRAFSSGRGRSGRAGALMHLVLLLLEVDEASCHAPVQPSMGKGDLLVQSIVGYIDGNYAEPIGLERLEREFYADRCHISHIFRKKTGLTVTQYVQYRRVMEAQKLLIKTEKPILDICMDCGFNNAQHFYRVFKSIAGMPPEKFRRARVYRDGGDSDETNVNRPAGAQHTVPQPLLQQADAAQYGHRMRGDASVRADCVPQRQYLRTIESPEAL